MYSEDTKYGVYLCAIRGLGNYDSFWDLDHIEIPPLLEEQNIIRLVLIHVFVEAGLRILAFLFLQDEMNPSC
jgi:hypothetical protein